MKRWRWIYMLECENGSFYTGMTDDLARRYGKHLRGTSRARYTRSFRPTRIAQCWKVFGTRGDAMKVERHIQGMGRRRKEELASDPCILAQTVREEIDPQMILIRYNPEMVMNEVNGQDADITGYIITDRDREIFNPMLIEIKELIGGSARKGERTARDVLCDRRTDLTTTYSFAIPTAEILTEIAYYSPLVEIGAGSGYWAMCLSRCGADVIAYDLRPPSEASQFDPFSGNQWFEDVWHAVFEGDAASAADHFERSLFLCWPSINDPMAYRALAGYMDAGGGIVIYIGDPSSSGDGEFHDTLRKLKCLVKRRIPGWPGIREELVIAECR